MRFLSRFSAAINKNAGDGTAAAPGMFFANDPDTGWYLVGPNIIGGSTGGTLRVSVASTGITSTVPYLGPDGSVSVPSHSFANGPLTGMYLVSGGGEVADELSFTLGLGLNNPILRLLNTTMVSAVPMNIKAGVTTPTIAGHVAFYVDSTDLKAKTVNENGVISTLFNDGLHDLNILTNGGFSIQQRVATAATAIPGVSTTTRAGQVADRWAVTTGNATTTQWTRVDTGAANEAGLSAKHYGKITQLTNAAKFIFSQFLANEDIHHLRGKKVRLSVKIKQFAGSNADYRLGLLQLTAAGTIDVCPAFISAIGAATVEPTWGTNLAAINPDASPTGENGTISGAAMTITSTAGWVRSSAVFTIPSDAKNLCVVLYRHTLGAASDAVGIAEFQMTEGPDIVEYVALPHAVEMRRCQRYFCKSFPHATVPAASIAEATAGPVYGILGVAGSGTALGSVINVQFPVVMWKAPTVTLFTPVGAGAVVYRLTGTTPAVQGTTAQRGLTDKGLCVTATNEATTNGAVGDIVGIHYTADAEFAT